MHNICTKIQEYWKTWKNRQLLRRLEHPYLPTYQISSRSDHFEKRRTIKTGGYSTNTYSFGENSMSLPFLVQEE